jgi:hypothetical protein
MSDDLVDIGADDPFVDGSADGVVNSTATLTYVNESGLPEEFVIGALRHNQELASVIEKWSQELAGSPTESLDVFRRNKWNNTNHLHAVMSQCAWAVENDDILSTLADVMEGLAFSKCRFEMYDEDQEDMWNQWAGDVDLDSQLRAAFRELFKVSQVYVGLWWEQRVYKVRDTPVDQVIEETKKKDEQQQYNDLQKQATLQGMPLPPGVEPPEDEGPGRGNRSRKKKFPVEVPTAMTIFDPTKVIPVGSLMFGRERFAYVGTRDEDEAFGQVLSGEIADGTVLQLIERKYTPTPQDKQACADLGIDHNRLWLFRENAIFRHTLTRSQYERFAPVRLKSALPILELKQHLRASDRASLIGNTNFIVVITKGTDRLPAKPAEIANLQEQARVIARLPVLVGDHRLKVEIVAPAIDNTLMESRHQVLDSRLVFKALQTFMPIVQGGNASSGVSEMSRVVAKGIENRRHMLVRTLERAIFAKVIERNQGVLDEEPDLTFTPKRVTLDFSTEIMNAILKVRDRGDISRETMLEELDYDQDVEVLRRAREKHDYDAVFQSSVPFGSPATNPFGGNAAPTLPKPGDRGRPPGTPESQPRKPVAAKSDTKT